MAANPQELSQHYFSLDEYFALEEASDARFEYWDGDIICMSSGSRQHGMISGNVFLSLGNGVRGTKCRAFTADTAIWTPTLPPYRYPDASVACGELKFRHVKNLDALVNPVFIVEVLSPSTASHDQDQKFVAYQAIETFRDYLLIAQDEPFVIHYARQDNGQWLREDVTSLDSSINIVSIDCTLTMREIYEEIEFLPNASAPPA
jgi:Uma2 family endonuclease